MIKFGDKYVLAKDYGMAKGGTVFEVSGFDMENGFISMNTDFECVCVDAEALNKLFVPFLGTINIDKMPERKRKFTEWKDACSDEDSSGPDLDGDYFIDSVLYDIIEGNMVKYRTNGKKVEVKILDHFNGPTYKGHATCNKCDDFNISTGFTIAAYRALKKMIDSKIEEISK